MVTKLSYRDPTNPNERLAGFERTTNVDISRVVIYQMSETYKAYDMECELTAVQMLRCNS